MLENFNLDDAFDEIKNFLFQPSDELIFYKIILSVVFKEFEPFEVRRDIEIPQKDDDGVVISFDDGRIVYFRIQNNQFSDEEFESILEVCYFLQDKFGGEIKSYILCRPEVKFRAYEGIERDGITLVINSLKQYDGDETVEILENKRKNKEKFTFKDHIAHILLPYMGYKDRKEFLFKFQHYMVETMRDNAEKHGIEVIRL